MGEYEGAVNKRLRRRRTGCGECRQELRTEITLPSLVVGLDFYVQREDSWEQALFLW